VLTGFLVPCSVGVFAVHLGSAISTRRFLARPGSVLLSATGTVLPYPFDATQSPATPWAVSHAMTEWARSSDRCRESPCAHQGLPRLVDAARMHRGEIAEAAEVRHIERENVAHRVDIHGRCQPRVVHLNSQHTVL
jgi:hypothetical protein